jgi:hypothetical protein
MDLDASDLSPAEAEIGGQLHRWSIGPEGLQICDAEGQRLDVVAAEVITALGGKAPSWLRVVDALEAAGTHATGREHDGVAAAVEALRASPDHRAVLARTTVPSWQRSLLPASCKQQQTRIAIAPSGTSSPTTETLRCAPAPTPKTRSSPPCSGITPRCRPGPEWQRTRHAHPRSSTG